MKSPLKSHYVPFNFHQIPFNMSTIRIKPLLSLLHVGQICFFFLLQKSLPLQVDDRQLTIKLTAKPRHLAKPLT